MKRAGWKVPPNTVYLAILCDTLEMYVCHMAGVKNSDVGHRADRLMVGYEPEKEKGMTIEEFNAIRNQVLKD